MEHNDCPGQRSVRHTKHQHKEPIRILIGYKPQIGEQKKVPEIAKVEHEVVVLAFEIYVEAEQEEKNHFD